MSLPAGRAQSGSPLAQGASPLGAMARVDSLVGIGQLEAALHEVDRSLGIFADDPRWNWQFADRQGVILLRLDRFQEALPLLEDAVRARPEDGMVHRNLGACLLGLGRRGRALSEYQQFALLEADNPLARLEHGQILTDFRQWAQAEREIRAAMGLGAAGPEVDLALVRCLLGTGRAAQAVEPLRRLHEGPEGAQFRRHLMKALLDSGADEDLIGLLGSELPVLDLDDVRLLVDAEGRTGGTRFSGKLVSSLTSPGDPLPSLPEGLPVAWRADPWLWARTSLNLQAAGQLREALVAIDQAITLDPRAALYRNNRVVLLQGLGREEEARAEWKRAVALDPSLEGKSEQ